MTPKTLKQWLEHKGRGAQNQLHIDARVSPRVITRALERRATLASATKISAVTGVPVDSMTAELDDPNEGKVVAIRDLKKKKRAARTRTTIETRRKRAARA